MKRKDLPSDLLTQGALNDREPVNQQIYHLLRKAIVTCRIQPGASLSEKEVSDAFGVSRQPVREAFIKLSEVRLLKVRPQRATIVPKIVIKQVLDGRFIREAIETSVVAQAAKTLSSETLVKLSETIEAQSRVAATQDIANFLALDDIFHSQIAEGIDCMAAWAVIEDLKAHMDRTRYLTLGEISPLSDLLTQHRTIFHALEARNEAKAVAAMKEHLQELGSTLWRVSRNYPDWFE